MSDHFTGDIHRYMNKISSDLSRSLTTCKRIVAREGGEDVE